MIVNPDKFQAILLDKRKSDHKNQRIVVENQNIKVLSSVELLGIRIDDKLNFNLHISNISRSAVCYKSFEYFNQTKAISWF